MCFMQVNGCTAWFVYYVGDGQVSIAFVQILFVLQFVSFYVFVKVLTNKIKFKLMSLG